MDSKELQFAFNMFKLQLQDTLTIVGKMILSQTMDKVEEVDTEEVAMSVIKDSMHNPFNDIIAACEVLKSEYEAFRESPELKEHLNLIKNEINKNPEIIDELVNASAEEVEQLLKEIKEKKDENLQ